MAITKVNGKKAISLRLAKKKVSITVFFDAVGQTVFDDSWPKADSTKYLQPSTETAFQDTVGAYVRRIRDDLLAALCAGIVTAGFSEEIKFKRLDKLPPMPKIEPDLSDEMIDWDNLPFEPDYRDHEFEDPVIYDFKLDPSFWDDPKLDPEVWKDSKSQVAHRYMLCQKATNDTKARLVARSPFTVMPDPFPHKLYILDPLQAWQSFFACINLPDEQWFSRYRLYRSVMLQELVTAGWRYLAVKKPTDKHGIISELA